MAANETVSISVKAQLANLEKQLAAAGNMTENQAKGMVIALEKRLKAAEVAAKAAAKAQKAAADAAEDLEGRVEGSFKGLEGLGRSLGGPLGAATASMGDMMDMAEGVSMAVGPMGGIAAAAAFAVVGLGLAAAGAVAGVFALEQAAVDARAALILPTETSDRIDDMSDRMDAASEAVRYVTIAAGELVDIVGVDLINAVTGATLVTAELVGELAGYYDELSAVGVNLRTVGQATVDLADQQAKLIATLGWLSSASIVAEDGLRALTGQTTRLEQALTMVDDAHDAVSGSMNGLTEQGAALTDQMREHREQSDQVHALELRRAEAEKALAADLKLRTERERAAAAATKEHARIAAEAARDQAAALKELAAIEREMATAHLDAEGQIRAQYDERVRKINEVAAAAGDQERVTKDLAAAEADRDRQLEQNKAFDAMDAQIRLISDVAAKVTPMFDEITTNMNTGMKTLEGYAAAAKSAAGNIAKGVENTAGTLMTFAKEGSRAYKALFLVQKSAAAAGVVVSTAKGISEAWALPFPMNLIQATAVGANGALQLANIRKTTMDAGVFADGSSTPADHGLAYVSPTEAILSSRGVRALGQERIDNLNAGTAAASTAPITVELRYGARALERVYLDAAHRPAMRGAVRQTAGRKTAVAGRP